MVAKGEIRCVAPVGDRCGEGVVWHAKEEAVYWSDINRFLIHKLDTATEAVTTWQFEEPVTALVLTDRDDIMTVVFASKVMLWRLSDHQLGDVVFRLSTSPAMRCNDARADPRGSLWVGTMKNNVGNHGEDISAVFESGVLYRIDPDRTVTEWKTDVGISNTLAWSPDKAVFYFADSVANAIYAYDYDFSQGTIRGERPFLEGLKLGLPDGSAIDSEGCLWNARYGAGCILCVARDGSTKEQLMLPVKRPTTCTFGGRDLKTLYITSAASEERFAGGLFAVDVSVPGLPENRFRCFQGF